ncbi:MAG: hypothetical protein M3014_08380 [Chloroflexota bacterium]|nr:hypothetical protein [Chloroflexota bacterium]
MEKQASAHDGSHDFDFLVGSWQVQNRRLLKRLEGCDRWESFQATSVCRAILGGLGNEDEFLTDHWHGFIGMSLRFFDPMALKWSIYWVDNNAGIVQPPVVGAFSGGRGEFYGPDEFGGRPIVVRFIWSEIAASSAHWEQAFSPDDGQSWETNWTMNLKRDGEG